MAFKVPGLFLAPVIVFVSLVISSTSDGICCAFTPGTSSSQPLYHLDSPSSCSYAPYPSKPPLLPVENENETCCWYELDAPVPPAFQSYYHTHEAISEASSVIPKLASLPTPEIFSQDSKEEDEQEKNVKPAGQLFDRVKSKVVAHLTQPDLASASAGTNNGASSGTNGVAKAMPVTPAQAQYSVALRALSEEDGDDSRSNFAAKGSGAKVLAYASGANNPTAILSDNQDSYLWAACNVRLWVIIELSQAVYVDTIVLGSYEYYSSTIYEFEIWGSASKLTEESAAGWTLLGNFTTATSVTVNGQGNNGSISDGSDGSNGNSNGNGNGNGNGNNQNRHVQRFLIDIGNLETLGLMRYLLIKPLTYHGKGPVCTLSVIRVFGMTHTERVHTVQTLQQAAKKSKIPGSNGHNGASAHRTQAVLPSLPVSGELNGSENLEEGAATGNSAPQQQSTDSQPSSPEEATGSDIEETAASVGEDILPKVQGLKPDNGELINGKALVDEENTTANNVDDHGGLNGHESKGSTNAVEDAKGHQANGSHSKDGQLYGGESKPDGSSGTEVDHCDTEMSEDQVGNVEPNKVDKDHESLDSETPRLKANLPGKMEDANGADAGEPEEEATPSREPGSAQNVHVEDVTAVALLSDDEEPHSELDTQDIDIGLSPSVEISMEYGSYDDLLDSVRSLELSQSVLESTVRALDGDYAIYFESLDKSISALKSALNRSRDEIEDLVQKTEYIKIDHGDRLTEMRELFEQLSLSVNQLGDKIDDFNRAHENRFSLSTMYTTFFEKIWPNRYSWIEDIWSYVYSQWNSFNSAVAMMVINGIFLILLTQQKLWGWRWRRRPASSPDRFQFCIERLELLAEHNESEIKALTRLMKESERAK